MQTTASQPSVVMQGNNPGGYRAQQPQAGNVAQPQQPPYPQGQQQFRFRTPMTTRNQQGQAGNTGTSSSSVGFGRGAPSYESGTGGTGVSRCVRTEGFLMLRKLSSQRVGSGQTHSGMLAREWEEGDSQVVARETLLSVVDESYFQDQQHFRERSYTYHDNTFIIQRVMNQRIT